MHSVNPTTKISNPPVECLKGSIVFLASCTLLIGMLALMFKLEAITGGRAIDTFKRPVEVITAKQWNHSDIIRYLSEDFRYDSDLKRIFSGFHFSEEEIAKVIATNEHNRILNIAWHENMAQSFGIAALSGAITSVLLTGILLAIRKKQKETTSPPSTAIN